MTEVFEALVPPEEEEVAGVLPHALNRNVTHNAHAIPNVTQPADLFAFIAYSFA
jgi:hypothetical protein